MMIIEPPWEMNDDFSFFHFQVHVELPSIKIYFSESEKKKQKNPKKTNKQISKKNSGK